MTTTLTRPAWRAVATLAESMTSQEVRAQADMALAEGWHTTFAILTAYARDLEAQGR